MKNEINVFHYGIISHSPRCWLSNVKNFFKNLKHAYQRVTMGYCDADCQDVGHHLSHIVPDMLITLGENCEDSAWKEEMTNAAISIYDSCHTDFSEKIDEIIFGMNMARACGAYSEELELQKELVNLFDEEDYLSRFNAIEGLEWLTDNWYNLWD